MGTGGKLLSKHFVPSRTFRVFQAGRSVCSKQDIPCVPSKTFLVFHAGRSVCSNQDIPCAPRRTFVVFQARHSLCSKQDISFVTSTTFLVMETGHCMCSNHQQSTYHFWRIRPIVRRVVGIIIRFAQISGLSLIHI